ncbi:MAG: DinB family protein [Dehalococcoidia bacterium]
MTTDQAAMVDRIGSYIRHNATKSPEALHDLVLKGHEQVLGLIEGLSPEQVTFKPGADDWSVLETLRHIVAAKRGVARVCVRLAAGETPGGVGGEGQAQQQDGVMGDEYATLVEARAAMDAAHNDMLAFVDGLASSQPNVEKRFNHFVFGDLNCREWAAFQRVHDGDHSGQIEQIKAAPGFPPA